MKFIYDHHLPKFNIFQFCKLFFKPVPWILISIRVSKFSFLLTFMTFSSVFSLNSFWEAPILNWWNIVLINHVLEFPVEYFVASVIWLEKMSHNYYLYLGGNSGNFGWWGLRGVRPRPADIFLKNVLLVNNFNNNKHFSSFLKCFRMIIIALFK